MCVLEGRQLFGKAFGVVTETASLSIISFRYYLP